MKKKIQKVLSLALMTGLLFTTTQIAIAKEMDTSLSAQKHNDAGVYVVIGDKDGGGFDCEYVYRMYTVYDSSGSHREGKYVCKLCGAIMP